MFIIIPCEHQFTEVREEVDQFGKVNIPKNALYGIQTARSVQNLSFSNERLKDFPLYINNLAKVKKAAALANFEAHMIDSITLQAIEDACNQIIAGKHREQFIVDMFQGGGGIGTNMNMNEVIANLANERLGKEPGSYFPVHPIEHVNASQSTSDVCYTAIRLAIMDYYEKLDHVLDKLQETMNAKANELMHVTTIARTCLQDGMRVQLGELFSGYATVLKRSHQAVKRAIENLSSINLGGTVIGSGLGANKAYKKLVIVKLREITQRKLQKRENLFDAAQNIDDLAQVLKELSILASLVIKIAKDIRLLASGPEAGLFEIKIPEVQAGSSFFPGKVNPVVPETVIQSCFQILGNERMIQASLEHGELYLNVFDGFAATNVMLSIESITNALTIFTEKCIEDIVANEERCNEFANSHIPIVLDLKEKIGYEATSRMLNEHGKDYLKNYYLSGGNHHEFRN